MSGKSTKRIARAVKKKSDEIKVQAMQEFIEYAQGRSLRQRVVFALRVIFKRMKV